MECFRIKSLKINIWKTIVMVIGSITKDGLSISIVCPYVVCSSRVKTNLVLCM